MKYLSTQEKYSKREQSNTQQGENKFDYISDDKEDLALVQDSLSIDTCIIAPQEPSLRALGTRRVADIGDPLIQLDNDEIPLPETSHLHD